MLAPAIVSPWRPNKRPQFTSVARSGKRSMIWLTCSARWKRKAQVQGSPKKSSEISSEKKWRQEAPKWVKQQIFQTGGNRGKRRNSLFPLFAPVEKLCPFCSHRLQL